MKKAIFATLAGLIIGIVMILIWTKFVDLTIIRTYISSVKWTFVIFSGIFYLCAYFVRSLRWNQLLGIQKKISVWKTYIYSLAGNLINYLIPIRAGELAKPYFLKRSENIPVSISLSTVVIDKFFDTIGIFIVLILIPFLQIELSRSLMILLTILISLFAIGFLILLLLTLSPHFMTLALRKVLFWLPLRFRENVITGLERFVEGMIVLRSHKEKILSLTFLTFLGVLLDALYFYCIFLAFTIQINFFMVLFGYTLINLSYALPQTPAQIGTNEWMMSIIFSAGFGYDLNTAAAIMAFAHVYTAVILFITGSIAIGYTGFGLADIFKRGA